MLLDTISFTFILYVNTLFSILFSLLFILTVISLLFSNFISILSITDCLRYKTVSFWANKNSLSFIAKSSFKIFSKTILLSFIFIYSIIESFGKFISYSLKSLL